MRISILLEKFKRGLNAVDRIVSSKNTLPILNNILIKTEDNQVVLSATDLEVGVNYYLGGKVESEGAITIPGKVLSNFINSLNEEKINLLSNNGVLSAKTEKSEASINGMAPDDFPIIPKVEGKTLAEIDGMALKQAISQVAFSVSYDESRPVLTGVYFKSDGKSLKLVATDSYRLAEKEVVGVSVSEKIDFIVPIKTINELHRIITSSEKIKIIASENQVMFLLSDMDIVSRIIEGEYPDYEQIIPKNFKTKAVIKTAELANIVKTASFFAKENANNIKMNFAGNEITVEAVSSQLGNFKSKIPCTLSGEDNEISFNAKYLLDALGGLNSNEMTLEMVGKLNPGVIKPSGGNLGITYIIMPLRN
ncbi:MAG: DNA polymerase III subunit beta [Patescibacteria group bacterium]|nr:DNA polymerase III subunit beta [Patescibacteria group bacterium]